MLFNDRFEWSLWRYAPLVVLAIVVFNRDLQLTTFSNTGNTVQHTLTLFLMGHAFWLALAKRDEDLVEPRRRVRRIFALSIVGLCVMIALGELTNILSHDMVASASLAHAVLLFSATFSFGYVLTRSSGVFQIADLVKDRATESVKTHSLMRLEAVMAEGIYRTEGLKIGDLALQLDMSEHGLRRLINKSLGHRNFPSFLNTARISEAKKLLADPANNSAQILQIALEVGYASIGPFNRAFKEIAGQTPSEYRAARLVRN